MTVVSNGKIRCFFTITFKFLFKHDIVIGSYSLVYLSIQVPLKGFHIPGIALYANLKSRDNYSQYLAQTQGKYKYLINIC